VQEPSVREAEETYLQATARESYEQMEHVRTRLLSAWTKIFISVMTLILTDMLRTELLLAETSTTRTSL
jgi:hypothetical protein